MEDTVIDNRHDGGVSNMVLLSLQVEFPTLQMSPLKLRKMKQLQSHAVK